MTLFAIQQHSWTTLLGWIRQTLIRLYNQLSVLYIQYTKIDFQLKNRNSNKFDLNFSPLNVYPSKTSLFKHFGRQVCMKWYPLAHLAAVTMSCFCEELQALQLLFPNSAGGIARAFPSFLLYIFKRPCTDDFRLKNKIGRFLSLKQRLPNTIQK